MGKLTAINPAVAKPAEMSILYSSREKGWQATGSINAKACRCRLARHGWNKPENRNRVLLGRDPAAYRLCSFSLIRAARPSRPRK